MTAGGKTPASMIMTGILQTRQMAMNAYLSGNYYQAAWLYAQMAELLPAEARKSIKNPNGLEIEAPPSIGDKDIITPDLKIKCRLYIERNVLLFHRKIPEYVYQYFERGRRMMSGY